MLGKNSNPAADRLRAGKPVSAAWLQAASPITAEILAEAGFDVLVIDLEHGPGDIMTTISQIHAMKGEPAVPFVRVPWNDAVWIKRVLDAGCYGLIVPSVSTAEEARAAAAACRFPPVGVRGIAGSARSGHFGNQPKAYFDTADKDIFLFIQIETPDGVRNLDEILAVEGVDGVFIGPMDLATTHGSLGNPDVPEIQQIIRQIEAAVVKSGKPLAGICSSFEDAKAKYDRGYQMVLLMHDTVHLGKLAQAELKKYREQVLKD